MKRLLHFFLALTLATPAASAENPVPLKRNVSFGCTDLRLISNTPSLKTVIDGFADAQKRNDQRCKVLSMTESSREMIGLINENTPEAFNEYRLAMRYLGQSPRLSDEARQDLLIYLQEIWLDHDYGLLRYLEMNNMQSKTTFWSFIILGVISAGIFTFQHSQTFLATVAEWAWVAPLMRVPEKMEMRQLRNFGLQDLLSSDHLEEAEPRLFASRVGSGTGLQFGQHVIGNVFSDLKQSPFALAGTGKSELRSSLTYDSFGREFELELAKSFTAYGLGIFGGMKLGGFLSRAIQGSAMFGRVQKIIDVVRMGRAMTLFSSGTVIGGIASVVLTAVILKILVFIQKVYTRWEQEKAIADLELSISQAAARHDDYQVYVQTSELVDRVRLLAAIMTMRTTKEQMAAESKFLQQTVGDPFCAKIQSRPFDSETARAMGFAELTKRLNRIATDSAPSFVALRATYDGAFRFIKSLRAQAGADYLDDVLLRLGALYDLERKRIDVPFQVERLQVLQSGVTGEYHERLSKKPKDDAFVYNDFYCPLQMPPGYIAP